MARVETIFFLQSRRFFESCSAAASGEHGSWFSSEGCSPCQASSSRLGEASTGKHFYSPCARWGIPHQWLRQNSDLHLLIRFPLHSAIFSFVNYSDVLHRDLYNPPNISPLFTSKQDATWQWTCIPEGLHIARAEFVRWEEQLLCNVQVSSLAKIRFSSVLTLPPTTIFRIVSTACSALRVVLQ